jgi:hypothetical protein
MSDVKVIPISREYRRGYEMVNWKRKGGKKKGGCKGK